MKYGKIHFILSIIGVSLLISVTSCSNPVTPPDNSSATKDAKTILSDLGVLEVSSPPPASIDQGAFAATVDPTDWQPLKKQVTVFSPRAEGIFLGAPVVSNTYGYEYSDGYDAADKYQPDSSFLTGDQSWLSTTAKTTVAADIDGDGVKEVVILYAKSAADTTLYYRVFKEGSVSSEKSVPGITLSGQSFNVWRSSQYSGQVGEYTWCPYINSAKGSLDSNGNDTVLFSDYDSVYQISLTGTGGVYSAVVDASRQYANPVSSLATGDVTGDHIDDILVCTVGGYYGLYSGSLGNPLTNPEMASVSGINYLEGTLGNFAGTNLDQMVLIGTDSSGVVSMYSYSFSTSQLGTIPSTPTNTDSNLYTLGDGGNLGLGSGFSYRFLPRPIDLNGDGKDSLMITGSIIADPMNGRSSSDISFLNTFSNFPGSDNVIVQGGVGDVDYDGKQDFALLAASGSGMNVAFGVYGLDYSGNLVEKYSGSANLPSGSPGYVNGYGMGVTFNLGNFKDNAARVHYAGHKLTFSDPIVLAVLASPPYFQDVANADSGYDGSLSGWVTTYGTTNTNGSGGSTNIGFSVGSTIEFEHDVNIPVFGLTVGQVKASVECTSEFNWEYANSVDYTKSITYAAVGGENKVVFTAVPIDQYQYIVDYSPDPVNNPVGSSLYITIPRDFRTYFVSADYFNANIDTDVTQPIDSSVLQQTIGKPFTYPTAAQKDNLLALYFNDANKESAYQSTAVSVAQGSIPSSGTTNLAITVNTTTDTTFSNDYSLDTSVGAGVGDWSASINTGFQTGYSSTTTTSNGAEFGGTVGYLPTSYYSNPNYTYQSGLFAYPYKTDNGRSFWVVNYWVTH